MQNINKCLLCCDTYEEFLMLKGICPSDYIVATSSYPFYKELCVSEERVIFLESEEINPYETLWDILDRIHDIIDSGKQNDDLRMFHFSYNIDEEFPLKVSQMIINLNLIHKVVQKYDINEINIFDKKDNWIINEAVFFYAKSKNIICHIWDEEKRASREILKTLETMKLSTESMKDSKLFSEEKKKVEEIKLKSSGKISKTAVKCEEIGMLYCSCNDNKQVDWLLRRKDAIGGKVRAICYYDSEDIRKFEKKGLAVDCMEDYFSITVFLDKYQIIRIERENILREIQEQLRVMYRGVDLSEWLFLKIRNHYYRELINYLYIDTCAEIYFEFNKFKYIHIWGNSDSWQTWVCFDHTRDRKTKLFKIDVIDFVSSTAKQPYQYMLSAIFAPTEHVIRSQFSEEYLGKTCFIRDVFWNRENNAVKGSRTTGGKKRIGILPTGLMSGFTTYYFYYGTLIQLIEKLLDRGYEVIFKYHSGLSDCWEEDVKQKFISNERFSFIDANNLVSDVLDQCDVVITDISSAAYDAAAIQKPVFCIVDTQGYQLISWHEEGFSIYQNVDTMIADIELVLNDEDALKRLVGKQSLHLEEITGGTCACMDGVIQRFLQSLDDE